MNTKEKEQITQKILELIEYRTDEPITLESSLRNNLDMDSMEQLDFIWSVEYEFKIHIDTDEWEVLRDEKFHDIVVQDVCDFIISIIEKQKGTEQ